MSNSALNRAQRGLSLLDIQQFKFDGYISDEYEPRTGEDESNLSFQTKKVVDSSSILQLNVDDNNPSYLFRVEIDLGIRYVTKEGDNNDDEEPWLLAQIEASYRLDYVINDEALKDDSDALEEFALQNAPHHVWSFWREYVDSQAGRMRLPRAMIPMLPKISKS